MPDRLKSEPRRSQSHGMRPRARGLCAAASVALLAWAALQARGQGVPAPPPAAAAKTTDIIHGTAVPDPYQWLEDSASPQTRAWIAAQQAYTASLLGKRPEMDGLRRDVLALADLEEALRVLFRRGRYFILKREPGHAIAALYLREGEAGAEKLLIDPRDGATTRPIRLIC